MSQAVCSYPHVQSSLSTLEIKSKEKRRNKFFEVVASALNMPCKTLIQKASSVRIFSKFSASCENNYMLQIAVVINCNIAIYGKVAQGRVLIEVYTSMGEYLTKDSLNGNVKGSTLELLQVNNGYAVERCPCPKNLSPFLYPLAPQDPQKFWESYY